MSDNRFIINVLYFYNEPMSEATNLIPEQHLMSKLSPSWQRRFEAALKLMRDEEEMTWQEIADQCAISSFHFLRMFRLIFNETPGRYKARIRLQHALGLLIEHDEISMMEIAHQAGYASGQSLAKALKRELGYSAKQIRKMALHFDQTQPLLNKLGHPLANEAGIVEDSIALEIPFQLIEKPDRYFQVRKLSPPGFVSCHRLWTKIKAHKTQSMINLASIMEWDLPATEQTLWVGYEVESETQANRTSLAGKFLHCRVLVDSEISYFSVWNAFVNYLMTHDLEFLEDSLMIEEVHNPDKLLTEPSDVSFYIAIDDSKLIENN